MQISHKDLVDFVRGAAFFGAGGGGDPYIGRLILDQQLTFEGRSLCVLPLDDLSDGALVVPVACMGAPTVMTEKLPSTVAARNAIATMEKLCGRKADALIALEIGGINATLPLVLAAETGLPVVDGDGMGRAFPEIQMVTYGVYGCAISPIVVAGDNDRVEVVYADTNKQGEQQAREIVIDMGGQAQIACYPMTGAEVKKTCVPATLTLALEVGRSIAAARSRGQNPFAAVFDVLERSDKARVAKVLFDGKITDIERRTEGGFNVGQITLQGIEAFADVPECKVIFQNENLACYCGDRLLTLVPDLIILMDRETAEPLTSESLKYGQRVKVVGVPAPEVMTTPAALSVFGPGAFNLNHDYRPLTYLAAGDPLGKA